MTYETKDDIYTTLALGEEDPITTLALGEEDRVTTMALGEEHLASNRSDVWAGSPFGAF